MTTKKPTNTRRRVTRETKARRPLPSLSRRARMTIAGTLGFTVGVLMCVQMLAEDASGGGRDVAVPLAMSAREAAVADAPKAEAAPESHTLREGDIVAHDALDLSRATVQDGRYVLDLPDGRRVTLTLVPELQQRAQSVLEKYKVPFGALVAVDPRTGAVLALADHSSEKPGDKGFALRAGQPSASVFKVITSAALIEGEGVSPEKKVCYHGGLRGIAKEHIEDSPRYDTACRTLAQALAHSTNPIFAKLADRMLDRKELMGWAERFGYNARIPFVREVEPSRADLPSERVKYAASAAGFHHSMLSPLHGALIMAALGNEGRMMEPYLVDKVEKGGVTIFKAQPRELRRVVAPETATALLDMMALTTKEGTAAKYFRKRDPSLAGISIAGKTGSLSSTDAGVRHHNSWFVAAAPAGAPEIGLAALVVNSGAWHIKGTHLGKAGLEAYFGARKKAAQSASGAPRP